MTTVERAKDIIIATLPDCKGKPFADVADILLDALLQKRIGLATMVASADMFVRWHAHCAHLGKESGDGYQYWYTRAVEYAMQMEDWPVKVQPTTVVIDGVEHTIDVRVPQSTKKANNRQLLLAYQVIQDAADELDIELPENTDD